MSAPERTTMNGKPVLHRPAKTVLNMKSAFAEKHLCDGPTFSAGDACAYSCSFCYVEAMTHKLLRHDHSDLKDLDHMDIVVRRKEAVETLRKQILALPDAVRAQGLTLYMSHSVDVAANMDLVRETVEACETILELTHWHIRILSKSNLLPKVAQLLTTWESRRDKGDFDPIDVKYRLIFGVSTGTLDDDLAAAFEQGCPKVSKRLESLHWLQDEGFRTFGMLCPSLPVLGSYQEWSLSMMNAIRADRCEHVWAEVINVRGKSMHRTCKALHDAGYEAIAAELQRVSTDKTAWEEYARKTFLAHACRTDLLDAHGQTKLRFLQYVTPATKAWWHSHQPSGAVLLGSAAHA